MELGQRNVGQDNILLIAEALSVKARELQGSIGPRAYEVARDTRLEMHEISAASVPMIHPKWHSPALASPAMKSAPLAVRHCGLYPGSWTRVQGQFDVPPQSLRSAPKAWPKKKTPRKLGSHEIDEWDERLMDREDRQAWIDAGLGDQDARIADMCKTYGITPDDLSLVVESRSVWDRLRSNESITLIA